MAITTGKLNGSEALDTTGTVDVACEAGRLPPALRDFADDEVLGKPLDNRALVQLARAAARLKS